MKEWIKVESEIFRFENEGDSIEGELLSIEEGATFGNEVYKIKTSEGVKTVFSTAVMQTQMQELEEGQEVKIVFIGEKPAEKKGHNPLKLFEVYHK